MIPIKHNNAITTKNIRATQLVLTLYFEGGGGNISCDVSILSDEHWRRKSVHRRRSSSTSVSGRPSARPVVERFSTTIVSKVSPCYSLLPTDEVRLPRFRQSLSPSRQRPRRVETRQDETTTIERKESLHSS
ncbi:unnamed protein product [Soboliphyme baturini]|uniref:Uncharacterized protein n=1 Tax=Soboliphyme baturini TaxID=241478 RepID=A0A183IZJ1_9BILA|nr:unnamed protein product [Soboliphyme baturini]